MVAVSSECCKLQHKTFEILRVNSWQFAVSMAYLFHHQSEQQQLISSIQLPPFLNSKLETNIISLYHPYEIFENIANVPQAISLLIHSTTINQIHNTLTFQIPSW